MASSEHEPRTDLSEAKQALLRLRMRQARDAQAARERIRPVPRDGRMPLSFQQEHLWFIDRLAPGSPIYNSVFALRLRGDLDEPALHRAVSRIVERHEVLRTRFSSEYGVPYQVIDPPPERVPVDVVDLREVPEAAREQRAREVADAQVRRPFDLATGPLLRLALLRLAGDDHVLVLSMHHVVVDGWSIGRLTGELATLYEAFHQGRDDPLPPLDIQYADFAAWQRDALGGQALERELEYWTERLRDLPALDFPADRPRPATRRWSGSSFETPFPARVRDELQALARARKVPLLAPLVAGFAALMARYTGAEDVAVGSVFGGRTRSEVEPLIGFFVNTVVLRTSVAGDPTFHELLARAGEEVVGALAHQDTPFGALVDALAPERDPSRNPLFQISFTLQAGGTTGQFRLGDLEVTDFPVDTGASRFDLAFQVTERGEDRTVLGVEYSTELFDRERMQQLTEHFTRVVEQAADRPDLRVSELRLLDERERERILAGWNPPPRPHGTHERLLHELVEAHAARQPSRTAVRFEGSEVTYGELDARANRLAHLLRERHGVGPESVVALLLDRGPALVASQLAVLKAGGAWLPLDAAHPAKRLAYQLADARPAVVVTAGKAAAALPAGAPAVHLDGEEVQGLLAAQPTTAPARTAAPDNLAYMIYTSGSTGRPKGVTISHRSVVNFVATCRELFSITPDDRVLQFANPAFDVSVFDVYAALGSGATLVAARTRRLLAPSTLTEVLRSEGVTVADIPPVLLARLDPADLPSLRALFVGLEPFPGDLVNRWNTPGREFHNGYGPTETTIACIDYRCPRQRLDTSPPIGRAMANHRAYVLDGRLEAVPAGIPGELFVAGAGLARGYLGRPGLTAERFVPDPFAPQPGERMYRTGDLARWRWDGNLEFIGRADEQIKLRGLRIEPGEVEHALAAHPGVASAAVTVETPADGRAPRLVAYAVAADGAREPDGEDVREFVARELPAYMVPSAVVFLDALPLTSSGKLDTSRLPAPRSDEGVPARELTPVESRLAAVWQEVLGAALERVRAGDSFFVVGGNSLYLVQLLARIAETFGVTLEMTEVFRHHTLERMAEVLERVASAPGTAPPPAAAGGELPWLLRLDRRAGDAAGRDGDTGGQEGRLPLFCVHPGGGSSVQYVPLARQLDAAQPFYALESPGLHGLEQPRRLDEIARTYLEAVRRVQPRGPYAVGGWSTGGEVAFEMACELREQGEELALVAILDSAVPPGREQPPSQMALLRNFVTDVVGLAGRDPGALPWEELEELGEQERVTAVIRHLERARLLPAGMREEVRRRLDVFMVNASASVCHRPRPLDARLTVVRAAGSGEHTQEWERLALRGIDWHEVPGDHYTMFQHPHIGALAGVLQRCLHEAAGAATPAPSRPAGG